MQILSRANFDFSDFFVPGSPEACPDSFVPVGLCAEHIGVDSVFRHQLLMSAALAHGPFFQKSSEYAKEKYIKNHAEEFDQSIEESATIYENEQKNNESSDHWCSWWTRTPGRWSSNFVIISLRGGGSSAGRVSSYSQGVRPAIWINIE